MYAVAVDARPWLERIARLLQEHNLDAVLIGNAAAALQGAPVTTIDVDFLFWKTPANVRKLNAIAKELDAVIMRPYYPASGLHRVTRDFDNLQLDFMTTVDGIRSFEGLKSRAARLSLGGTTLMVADLADIIKSKKAARRPQDLAVMPVLERALAETRASKEKSAGGTQEGE